MNTLNHNREELQAKFDQLNELKTTLKNEYFGVDATIDQIVESFTPWYLFPELQLRPTIVNLWGLTGVGKTSLVKRLVTFLDLKDRYLEVDMGNINSSDRYSDNLDSKINSLKENNEHSAFVFCFDEFQHLRTVSEKGEEEKSNANNRAVWTLLDSGKIYTDDTFSFELGRVYSLRNKLYGFLNNGVVVQNGKVVAGYEFFEENRYEKNFEIPNSNDLEKVTKHHNQMKKRRLEESEVVFVPSFEYSHILELTSGEFFSLKLLHDFLMSLDGTAIIKFLDRVIKNAQKPIELDCSKSIIFVTGNLDEAYGISNDFTPDVSADIFYEESLKITISDIKQALKKHFRLEQIARLGNNHVLYPALSAAAYRKIAEKEFKNISQQVLATSKTVLRFESSILDFVLSEGVYPTLGARPLFTTIDQYIKPIVGKLFQHNFEKDINTDEVSIGYENESVVLSFYKESELVHTTKEKQKAILRELRKAPQDDSQAIVAVHEAGHVVLSLALLQSIPQMACSISSSGTISGFVKRERKLDYISRKRLINELAVFLGGIEAERFIFGEEYITLGSSSDLSNATELAANAIRSHGFGDINVSVKSQSPLTDYAYFDVTNEFNNKIALCIKQATELAQRSLKEHKNLLLAIANYLSDETTMDTSKIREFVEKHSVLNLCELDADDKHTWYRNKLKNQLKGNSVTKQLSAATINQLNKVF